MAGLKTIKKESSNDKFYLESPVANTVRKIILSAIEKEASDIHWEPQKANLRVRIRTLGEMSIMEILDSEIGPQALTHIKRMANLQTQVKDITQDGSFSIEHNNGEFRFRVAISPTLHGESVVMRINKAEGAPNLDALGFERNFFEHLKESTTKSQGLIIITGPTGSGKSSTLQALLNQLNDDTRKIIAIEDPIEREIEGVLHKGITDRNTWAESIKMSLREDPDVILIGEIRDKESASLAIEAAQTGHLVLTTLHTNSAKEVYDRMETLGVEKEKFDTSLLMVTAQRLVKQLCSGCKVKEGEGYARGAGCEMCKHSQITGVSPKRIPVNEFITKDNNTPIVSSSLKEKTKKLYTNGMIDKREYDLWS